MNAMRALASVVVLLGLASAGLGRGGDEQSIVEWIRDLGGVVSGVGLQSIPGMGTGIVATGDLEAGTVVTRTPLSALISLEHALVSEMFVSLTEELPGLSNTNLKALFLAHEMKKSQRGGGREEGGGEGAEEHEGENMTQGCGKRDTGRVDCGAEENGAQLVDEGEEETGRERAEEEKEEEEEEEEEKEEEEEEVAEKEEEEEEEKKKEREEIEEEVDKEEKEVKKEKEEEEEENEEEEEEEEEGGRSFWQPYLDSLPTVLHTTLFFTEDDLLHLQTSMVREFAERQQRAAKKAYEMVSGLAAEEKFSDLQNLSLEDLKWGVSIWSSRAHSVRVRDSLGEWQIASCLVPVADMFNMAGREADISIRCDTNEDSTHFECRTTQPVSAGQQLLAEYVTQPDKRHNGRLLIHYGFVLPGNPYDSVSIKLPEITHDLAHYKERQEFSKKLQVLKKPFLQLTHPSVPNPSVNELLKVVRVIHGSVPELQRAARQSSPFSLPLSPSSEDRVLKKSQDFLRDILSSYHTTAEQDIHTLHSGRGLSQNSWLAVVLRSEEKRILTANMGHLLSLLSHQQPENTHRHKHHHNHRRKTEL